jgi:hypothetical protein
VPKVLVVAQCEDPVKWEQGFRTHADLFRIMTITKSMTYGISEGNHIAVCGEPSDLAAYMKVLECPQQRKPWPLMAFCEIRSKCSSSTKN